MPGRAAGVAATRAIEPSMSDPRAHRKLRRSIGIFAVLVAPFSMAWTAFGVVAGDPALVAVGMVGLACSAFMAVLWATSAQLPASALAIRAAIGTNVAIVAAVTAEPAVSVAMTMAAIIPPVLALVHVSRKIVLRLMVVGTATSAYAAVAPSFIPWGSVFPFPVDIVLPVMTLVVAYLLFQLFLWNASGQLTEAATELTAAMDLSREVSQTLDPQQVAKIIARHIALAAEVAECTLSMWDRDNDQIVTFASYPPGRSHIAPTFALVDFPATRRVLMTGVPCWVDVNDPNSDPDEVAYLRSEGEASMVILPLVVRGESIGILELASAQSNVFSDRSVQLAQLLAREAAFSLENARLYDEIHDQAFRDALTGLANRRLFLERLSHALDRLRGRSTARVAVVFLDIDNFKHLNDRLGHPAGDEILQTIGERLRLAIRPGDTAARLGGDEFAVLLEDVTDEAVAIGVAERLIAGIGAPIALADGAPRIGASIGVALSGISGITADDLLRNADIAMYAAKAAGRGRIQLFQPELLERAAARSDLDARLRGAVERDELRLEYQPVLDLASDGRRVVGFEALVRWDPAGRPRQMPGDFIGLAEETGEIVGIGRWVIAEACRQASTWQRDHDRPDLRINVNLSARQFTDPALTSVVAAALRESGLPPSGLTLEITESTLMARTRDMAERVRSLRAIGVRISIDDFGTGYSSLGYLQTFELDELKIDRSFVSPADSVGSPRVISRAIVELGRALGLEMVAEGIETEEQARWFRSLGCQLGQGYYFAEPLAPAQAGEYLAEHGGDRAAPAKITRLDLRRRRRAAAG
jgi:diguanylate cyclase (GGDEF)-like protein